MALAEGADVTVVGDGTGSRSANEALPSTPARAGMTATAAPTVMRAMRRMVLVLSLSVTGGGQAGNTTRARHVWPVAAWRAYAVMTSRPARSRIRRSTENEPLGAVVLAVP